MLGLALCTGLGISDVTVSSRRLGGREAAIWGFLGASERRPRVKVLLADWFDVYGMRRSEP
ncbi:hypothetical protein ACE1SV_13260 [Streptomyces sennicomposti]